MEGLDFQTNQTPATLLLDLEKPSLTKKSLLPFPYSNLSPITMKNSNEKYVWIVSGVQVATFSDEEEARRAIFEEMNDEGEVCFTYHEKEHRCAHEEIEIVPAQEWAAFREQA
jgi:hypothetical protein